jgi:subtilase family serine protease
MTRPTRITAVLAVAAASLSAAVTLTVSAPAATAAGARPVQHVSCTAPKSPARARCLSSWRPAAHPHHARGLAVQPEEGLGPEDIAAAYRLPAGGAAGTIAIVDAYDNPNVERDLAYYRSAFGLPACTAADGCFTKTDQRGGKKYPDSDPGWGVEIALDVQAASAACPQCRILLVEADDASFENLGAAVRTAVRLKADVVSNSYGAEEYRRSKAMGEKYYYHPHTPMVVSSGDWGFTAASFPAVLNYVWAVGGTTLTRSVTGAWQEKAWQWAGSGCSAWIPKPSYQKDTNCSMRTTSDVAAVADPATGLAVFDTYGLGESNGWIVVGGTSLSAPLIAGLIARAGNGDEAWKPSYAYSHASGLKDVVGGGNGACEGTYLCTGVKGYDGPTGLGSPQGLSAF